MGGEKAVEGRPRSGLPPAGEESQADTALWRPAVLRWPAGTDVMQSWGRVALARTERTAAKWADLVGSGLVLNWSATRRMFFFLFLFFLWGGGGGFIHVLPAPRLGRRRGPRNF